MLLLAILALTFIMFRYTMLNAEGEQIVVLGSYRPIPIIWRLKQLLFVFLWWFQKLFVRFFSW